MPIYISQLRRGTKDDAQGIEDWAEYKTQPRYIKPLNGELVLEDDNGIPRLKIGDGVRDFDELPYISIDSFILPKQETITLSTTWDTSLENRPFQIVTVANATITPKSKVDLQPTSEQLNIFYEKDLTFVAENEYGTIKVYCIGQIPQNQYTIPVTVTEVVTNETRIVGNTTVTPYPHPDWAQDDDKKADYIKNKPNIQELQTQINAIMEILTNNGLI